MNGSTTGEVYWRSLDQRADEPTHRRWLDQEFAGGVPDSQEGLSRRKFLSLMGASLALAGLSGCRKPVEKIIPYVNPPEEIVPGVANYYATTIPLGTEALGVVVECHEGRPTKIEGNPRHPSTRGASSAWLQAAVLGLYDPDRSKRVTRGGAGATWDDFLMFWSARLEEIRSQNGRGLAFVTESFASPTRYRLWSELQSLFPDAGFYCYEALGAPGAAVVRDADSGRTYRAVYRMAAAQVILAVESDLLLTECDSIANARGFAAGRRLHDPQSAMNRLYAVESAPSVTGAAADHRLPLRGTQAAAFLVDLAFELKRQGANIDLSGWNRTGDAAGAYQTWLQTAARDLWAHRGRSLVAAGRLPLAGLGALAYAINSALGNIDQTVLYYPDIDSVRPDVETFKPLAESIRAGGIDTMVMLGGNPVYDQPAGTEFAEILRACRHSIHFGPYANETAQRSEWHLPETHPLESWGDARSAEGIASVIQPMIEPLFGGKTAVELLYLLAAGRARTGYELVRETWQGLIGTAGFEARWREVLHEGLLAGSGPSPGRVRPDRSGEGFTVEASGDTRNDLEIQLKLSIAVHDGRFANNGWLQELPDPITKLTWDNAALLSPRTAAELSVAKGDILEINHRGHSLAIPAWIQPGHADYAVTLPLGYGRTAAGRVGDGVGFNAYPLRPAASQLWLTGNIEVKRTGRRYEFACTQDHGSMAGRPIIREATRDQYRAQPEFASHMVEHPPLRSLFTEHKYDQGYQWGMTIDLTACIGCNACTLACQSENNVPIVGKRQVGRGREMHWLRIDRYYNGDPQNPGIVFQPVPCQHCENAPCETVCPVSATVHNAEGINQMTYNRCIGTRYCSNNCPYKVRRFNFFNYTKAMPDVVRLGQNPDVTVRSRGVMEKCTFCIQRINRAKRQAKSAGRQVRDGEVLAACQQACPTEAIRFGNILDPKSDVAQSKQLDRNYHLLAELNVRPRNSYLARIRNPNPALKEES